MLAPYRLSSALLLLFGLCLAQTARKRSLNLNDLYRLQEVSDPQCSPDGKWVAYSVSTIDREADKHYSNIWMVSWDGTQHIQLTYDRQSESSPRWSPDGRYLSFLSARSGPTKGSQIWVLDGRGGDARQLTHIKDHTISQYAWSPDSQMLLLVMQEKNEPDTDDQRGGADTTPQPPKPIVIDRYHFKEDVEGYLTSSQHNHLYLFQVETGKLTQLTTGRYDETAAVWSPDGSKIAFVSNRDKDPDRTDNTDVFVVGAHAGATPRKLTNYPGPDSGKLAWSPDSRRIAYLQGSASKYTAYNMNRLAIVPAAGGDARLLTAVLDRGVSAPVFTTDGTAILALVADDRSEYPAKIAVESGAVERLVSRPVVVSALSSAAGHTAVLASTDEAPPEVYALEGGALRKLSAHNAPWLAEINLGAVDDIAFKSHDGTDVHGLLTKPPDDESGKTYPTLLRIHGGPNGQDGHAFSFERQFFAANGYVVISVNYRGSAGRGEKYGESIFADWGNKEVADLLAGVDHVLGMGIADPDRLGIGGWSYGGILTDYTIASDQRFKAAISGAGSADQIAMYGVDEYVRQYDIELGPPWQNPEAWIKVSYPFFKAERIHTPTLFMGGDKDFNVPLIGGEQMYQALRTLGIPTELVIYPGEFHGFKRPSFIRDRYERYLAWYDRYVKTASSASTERSDR